MNCAFEDCRLLDGLLATDAADAFARFEQDRREDTEAIAAMALENYLEMRDTVLDPRFRHQQALALALERRHPQRFVPRYAMVMFHDEIGYATARARGRVQQQILDRLVPAEAGAQGDPDWALADRLILESLPPLP